MIPKTKIEEAASLQLSKRGVSESHHDIEPWKTIKDESIKLALWAIAEIEKTSSVGFEGFWSESRHSIRALPASAKHIWQAAWIACSLAKDKEIEQLRSIDNMNHKTQIEQAQIIQSLEAQLKERDERIERLLKENHQMIRNEQEYCNQIKERDEALLGIFEIWDDSLEMSQTIHNMRRFIGNKHPILIDKIKGSK